MTSTPTHDEELEKLFTKAIQIGRRLERGKGLTTNQGGIPHPEFFERNYIRLWVNKIEAREKLIREQADAWWITTNMKQNGKKLLGPFSSRDLALSVRTYMEIAEAPATYWVEQLNSSKTKLKKEG